MAHVARAAPAHGTTMVPRIRHFSSLRSMAFGLAAYLSPVGYQTCRATLASMCWSTLLGELPPTGGLGIHPPAISEVARG